MVPDCDLQLLVVIKALRDVVIPAVDPADRLAVEQIKLSLATLEMVRSRVALSHKCIRKELGHAVDLALAIRDSEGTESLEPLLADAGEAMKLVDPEMRRIEQIREALLSAVCKAIDSADAAGLQRMGHIVVAKSKSQIELQRAWCAPSGFEPDASAIPALEDLLCT